MADKLRSFVHQLAYVPRTLRLIRDAAGILTAAWLVLLVVEGLLPAATVYLTRMLVDNLAAALGAGVSWEAVRPIFLPAALMGSVMLLTQLVQTLMEWVRTAQAEHVRDHLSALIHMKATQVDLAFYELSEYHDRLYRARSDLSTRPLALLENAGGLVQNGITLLAMGALLIPYGLWLPIVLLLSTLPAFLVMLRINRRYHRWWEQTTTERRWTQYFDTLLTLDAMAAEVRLFDLGPHFSSAFQKLRGTLRTGHLRLIRAGGLARLGAGLLAIALSGAALAWMLGRALQGWVTLGDLALFYQAFNKGQGLLRSLLGSIGQVYDNVLYLENLYEFLDQEPEVREPAAPLPAPANLQEGIHFRGVTFRYPGSARPVFENFDFSIPAGKVVAIVGANGVGKTTMMKLLCRFYDPEAGAIELDGQDVRGLALAELRRLMSVMFQLPMLYMATAGENIALSDLAAQPTQADIEAAARRAGAHEFITRLPQGYDTLMGKWFASGTELSGGERQRLALARAFHRRAQIMILDEPTSFMDSWAEVDWFERFRELARGRTAIVITHRFTIAKDADIIYVMDQGRIVEAGSHAELLARGGLYAQSWIAQTRDSVPGAPQVQRTQESASHLAPQVQRTEESASHLDPQVQRTEESASHLVAPDPLERMPGPAPRGLTPGDAPARRPANGPVR